MIKNIKIDGKDLSSDIIDKLNELLLHIKKDTSK